MKVFEPEIVWESDTREVTIRVVAFGTVLEVCVAEGFDAYPADLTPARARKIAADLIEAADRYEAFIK